MLMVILLAWLAGIPVAMLSVAGLLGWRHGREGVSSSAPVAARQQHRTTLFEGRPLARRSSGCDLESSPAHEVGDRPDQYLEIEPDRPVRAVEVVDLHHLGHWDPSGTVDLPQAGHPRSKRQPSSLPPGDQGILVGHEGPRTN